MINSSGGSRAPGNKTMTRIPALLILLLGAGTVRAHFPILLPGSAVTARGEAVPLVVRWGHPFEHELFDADQPRSLFVLGPDGRRTDLLPQLEKDATSKATGYRV